MPDGTEEPETVEVDGRRPEDPPAETELVCRRTTRRTPEPKMRLIAEEITQVDFLCEEKEGKKNYFIEGIFLQAELKNRNGQNVSSENFTREVAKYDENYIQKGRALGELGHPDGPSINLDRVSHKIQSLKEDGNNFVGKAKLLDTPMGQHC